MWSARAGWQKEEEAGCEETRVGLTTTLRMVAQTPWPGS